jgi:hypothetical protein
MIVKIPWERPDDNGKVVHWSITGGGKLTKPKLSQDFCQIVYVANDSEDPLGYIV